jgi:hypothetical protein
MGDTFDNTNSYVDVTATGVGAVYRYRAGAGSDYIYVVISGTFVGTLSIDIARPDASVSDNTLWTSMSTATTPTSILTSLQNIECDVRVRCTAYTSGKIRTAIIGAARSALTSVRKAK